VVARPDELESVRIQQEIDRTRDQMSGTIDEIQERLTPSRLLHDATASVREAGVDSVRRVLSQAGRTANRGAGQARKASAAAAGYAKTHPMPVALLLSGMALILARGLMRRRRRSAWVPDDVPSGGREPINDLHVHREFQDWAEPASNSRRTTASVTSWMAENPLAVGAAVAAAGTVVGLSRAAQREPVTGTDTVRR
jgi:hypothetical protein